MKRLLLRLSVTTLLLTLLVSCGKSPAPPVVAAPSSGDPHAAEQLAMEQGTPDFANLLILRLQSEGQRVEVTSVLPATIAGASVSGQTAKTIFRVNEKGNGLLFFSRDLLNGKSFRTELSLLDWNRRSLSASRWCSRMLR